MKPFSDDIRLHGFVERRLLVNFQADPKVVSQVLPPQLQPRLIDGIAIVGICLIRMTSLTPRSSPFKFGLKAENAAHRIAVVSHESGAPAVYIPRRDTSSLAASLSSGRIFPVIQNKATFKVIENEAKIYIRVKSKDGTMQLHIDCKPTDSLSANSYFSAVTTATEFFRSSPASYSPSRTKGKIHQVEASFDPWNLTPVNVTSWSSSYFQDQSIFPSGSLILDSAFLMKDCTSSWQLLTTEFA